MILQKDILEKIIYKNRDIPTFLNIILMCRYTYSLCKNNKILWKLMFYYNIDDFVYGMHTNDRYNCDFCRKIICEKKCDIYRCDFCDILLCKRCQNNIGILYIICNSCGTRICINNDEFCSESIGKGNKCYDPNCSVGII